MAKGRPDLKLMRQIVSGIGGWVAFQQATTEMRQHVEQNLYPGIATIGKNRGWIERRYERIKRDKIIRHKSGRFKNIDHVFYKSRKLGNQKGRVAFIEVTLIKQQEPGYYLGKLRDDIDKLNKLKMSHLIESNFFGDVYVPAKFLLIFGQVADLHKICNAGVEFHTDIQTMMLNAIDSIGKQVYTSLSDTYLKQDLDWMVIAIGKKSWPT